MAPISAKKALKLAKECLASEDYEGAIDNCKIVLKEGRNHVAYIFLAKGYLKLNKPKESLEALRHAEEMSPDVALTWQGFASYYEAFSPNDAALLEVYTRLMGFPECQGKIQEYLTKLSLLYERHGQPFKSAEILVQRAESTSEKSQKLSLWGRVVLLLKSIKIRSDPESEMLDITFQNLIEHESSSSRLFDLFQDYIQFLSRTKQSERALMEAERFHRAFGESPLALETLMGLQVGCYFGNVEDLEELQVKALQLKEFDPESLLPSLVFGLSAFREKSFLNAIKFLEVGLGSSAASPYCWHVMVQCRLKCYRYEEAEQDAQTGCQAVRKMEDGDKKTELLGKLLLSLAEAYAGLKQWDSCFQITGKVLGFLQAGPEVLHKIGCIYLQKNELGEVSKIIKAMPSESPLRRELECTVLLSLGEHDRAESLLQDIAEDLPYSQHLLARLYFETDDYSKAIPALIKAVTLDPYLAKNYYYLGCIYRSKNDAANADKCFRKGLALNANDQDMGAALADLLLGLGEREQCMSILEHIMATASLHNHTWTFKRLGIIHFEDERYVDACNFLKRAVQASPSDSPCWEILGDIYIHFDSFDAAIKSFKKAFELNDQSLYSLYKLSLIHQTQGLYEDAIQLYEELISKDPTYLPGLKGLAECYFARAREHLAGSSIDSAKMMVEKTCSLLDGILSADCDMFIFWKLLGDTYNIVYTMDVQYFPIKLCKVFADDVNAEVNDQKGEILKLGELAYQRALDLEPDLAGLWYALGVNYYHQWKESNGGQEERFALAQSAFGCSKMSVQLFPEEDTYWNLLGIAACLPGIQELKLAQHSFVKAVTLESESAVNWTNLAVFYLEHKAYMLAQEAIKIAECKDLSYPHSWIVQAILSEVARVPLALGFFRHASLLSNHREGVLGYAHNVCQALLDPTHKDLANACLADGKHLLFDCETALIKYTDNHSLDFKAFIMLSLIQERLGNFPAALKSCEKAYELLSQSDSSVLDEVRSNQARILLEKGDFAKALDVYSNVERTDLPFLALLADRDKRYADAVQLYGEAIQSSESDSDKSQLLVALTFAIVKLYGVDEARPYIVKSSEMELSSVEGLMALYAVGILQKDTELCKEAMEKLENCGANNVDKYKLKIANLVAHEYSAMGYPEVCEKYLNMLHLKEPENADIGKLCCKHSIFMQKWENTGNFAKNIVKNGGAIDAEAILGLSMTESHQDGMLAAQTAIRNNPESIKSWLALLSCMIPRVLLNQGSKESLYGVFDRCLQNAQEKKDSESLAWLQLSRVWVALSVNDDQNIEAFIKDAGNNFIADMLNSFRDPSTLDEHPAVDQYLFSWLAVANFKTSDRMFNEATSILKSAEEFSIQNNQQHWIASIYFHLSLNLLKFMEASNGKNLNIEGLHQTFFEYLKIIPSDKNRQFLQTCYNFYKGDKKAFKKNLEKLVYLEPGVTRIEGISRMTLFHLYKPDETDKLEKLVDLCAKLGDANVLRIASATRSQN